MIEIRVVSDCCKASVEQGSKPEYPLGGKVWGIQYKVDVCGDCGRECEPVEVEVFECCGEEVCECQEVAV